MRKLLWNVSERKGPIWRTWPKEWIQFPLHTIHKAACINTWKKFWIWTRVWNFWPVDGSVICFNISVHHSCVQYNRDLAIQPLKFSPQFFQIQFIVPPPPPRTNKNCFFILEYIQFSCIFNRIFYDKCVYLLKLHCTTYCCTVYCCTVVHMYNILFFNRSF